MGAMLEQIFLVGLSISSFKYFGHQGLFMALNFIYVLLLRATQISGEIQNYWHIRLLL